MSAADLLAEIQPEPQRDRYGRYLLPHLSNGRVIPWTRATTWAQSLSDKFGLNAWEQRMVAKGLAMRPDLLALAASSPISDKSTLDRVAKDAKEAAASSSGANQGTALHRFTESLDRGEPIDPPEPWAADVEAYADGLRAANITPVPEFIERIVVVRSLTVAGTLDRIVRRADGSLAVLDLKTGKDLSYAWPEISIQLGLYANADRMWNALTNSYEDMPQVDRHKALVAWVPVGKATCEIYEVDITAGWEAAQLCGQVRSWRKRKSLASQLGTQRTPAERIAAAKSNKELHALWEQAKTNDQATPEVIEAVKTRKAQLKSK